MESFFNPMEEGKETSRDSLVRDLKAVIRDAEALMQETASDAGEKAKEARARLADVLSRAKASCQRLEQKVEVTAKAADKIIRDHPYESIGIAFGVGLLLGVLASRK